MPIAASCSAGAAALNPKDSVRILLFHQEVQLKVHLCGAPGEGKYLLGLFWHLLQFGVEALQRSPQSNVFFAVFLQEIAPVLKGKTPLPRGQQRKEQRGMVAQAANRSGDGRRIHAMARERVLDVARQFVTTRVADGDAKVAARHIFQLVGLVKNYQAGLRQNTGIGRVIGLLLDRQVREKKVMIHDHDVAFRRLAPHRGDEAAVKLAALLPATTVGTGVQLVPERARLRHGRQFGAVPGRRKFFPAQDFGEMIDLFQSAQHGIRREVVELPAAQIIAASLHVADVQLALAIGKKRLLEKRNIFVKELLLQVFCTGRDDHPFAGANYRQQISERFASTGAGLDDQVALLFERLFHRLGHLQLPAAKLVGRMRF